MEVFWDLAKIAFGSALALVASYIGNRQSASTTLAVARATRRFEVGREAYKSAQAAIQAGRHILTLENLPPLGEEAISMISSFYQPLVDARINLALPVTLEMKAELVGAVFAVFLAHERGQDTNPAKDRLRLEISKHEDEIVTAWQQIVHHG